MPMAFLAYLSAALGSTSLTNLSMSSVAARFARGLSIPTFPGRTVGGPAASSASSRPFVISSSTLTKVRA